MSEKIKVAKVENINDPDKKGRFQVRILPEMISLKVSDLPWARKYSSQQGTSSTVGEHKIPEVGTFIRVLVEDWPILKRIYYISDDCVDGLCIYNSASVLSGIDELSTQTYPQPIFKRYKDGTIEFHNSVTSEHGVFFANGEYQIKDDEGNFYSYSKNKEQKIYNDNGYFSLTSNGEIQLNGSTSHLVTHEELSALLIPFLTTLNATFSSKLNGSGSPGAITLDISSAKSDSVTVKAQSILP